MFKIGEVPTNNVGVTADNSSSFKYKSGLMEGTVKDVANGKVTNTNLAAPISNFWRSLEISLINWKTYLKLKLNKKLEQLQS